MKKRALLFCISLALILSSLSVCSFGEAADAANWPQKTVTITLP